MSALENVISMGVGKIYKEIENFLKNKGDKSANTRVSYEREIRRFFELIKYKKIEFLTRNDVQIAFDDLEYFKNCLVDQKDNKGKKIFNNKTINHHVSAVAELLRYLHMKKIVDDISCLSSLKTIRLKENNKNKYDPLNVDEVYELSDWIMENEIELKFVKYYFVLFSLDTCLRKEAVLSLEWSDFAVIGNEVIIKTTDKGDEDFRGSINLDFYEEILKLKEIYNNEKVFNIASSTIQKTFKKWRATKDFKGRRIVIHSIRKAGASFQYRLTGDILQAKKVLGHKNTSTTELYLDEERYGAIGVVSRGKNVDDELYKKVSREDLEKAIESITGYKMLINIKLKEILKNNKEN